MHRKKAMMKKKESIENTPQDSSKIEKLRDDLFQYRVEIQSYKRSMNILSACVSIVIALLGFFGYNKVESLLDKVEQGANERLAKTDELLDKIDTHYLDSLKLTVEERTLAYEQAISALEKGTRVNNELYKKLITGLPYNKRSEVKYDSYILRDATNIFDVVFYSDKYSLGQTGECYIVMGDEFVKEKYDVLLVEVLPKQRNVAIYYQMFEVYSNYNKLHFKFGRFEQYKDYELAVILLRKKGKDVIGYMQKKPISIN